MEDREFIVRLRQYKEDHGYTLHRLSQLTDIHIATLERWFKTNRINKVYAQMLKQRLGIK